MATRLPLEQETLGSRPSSPVFMKMILASNLSFLLTHGYALTGIPKNRMKIGYIITASKGASSTEYIRKIEKELQENGYNFAEFDFEDKTREQIEKFFEDKDVIHIEGGDTFYLLKAIKKTGFDKILVKMLIRGKIYVGTSAGASIMGPSIEFSSHIPSNASEEDLKALGLAPFLIKCHYTDDQKQEFKKRSQAIRYPVKFLRDGQGILVEGDKYTFIGEGNEVQLD